MSERDKLKSRAKKLGLNLPGNISNVDLKAAVAEAEAAKQAGDSQQAATDEAENNGQANATDAEQSAAGSEGDGQQAAPAGDGASAVPPENSAAADLEPVRGKTHLRVVGPAGGFRRAGRSFGPVPVEIPLEDLTDAQIAAIEAEPRLVSQRVEPTAIGA